MLAALRLLRWRFAHPDLDRIRREVIARAQADERYALDADLRDAVAYLNRNPLRHALYPALPPPRVTVNDVQWDAAEKLHFILHRGHRLYWHEGAERKTVARGYAGLVAEQHETSPHRYCLGGFDVKPGDIVADVGAAEGIFGLDVVERAAHVHLFEADPIWQRALAATFRPWSGKVTVHRTLVGQRGQSDVAAIDDLLRDAPAPTFYKLDVEGYEGAVLDGARETIARAVDPRLAVCAYHRVEDERILSAQLNAMGFHVEASRGWILIYRAPQFGEPYFRRGVLRARR